jgi:hypothetical protein
MSKSTYTAPERIDGKDVLKKGTTGSGLPFFIGHDPEGGPLEALLPRSTRFAPSTPSQKVQAFDKAVEQVEDKLKREDVDGVVKHLRNVE